MAPGEETLHIGYSSWNTQRIQATFDRWRSKGRGVHDDWLRRSGPAHFTHVNFPGALSFPIDSCPFFWRFCFQSTAPRLPRVLLDRRHHAELFGQHPLVDTEVQVDFLLCNDGHEDVDLRWLQTQYGGDRRFELRRA